MKKRILSSLLALFLVLAFGACGEDISTPEPNAEAGTWAIYWYLCGSDLESNGGFATSDLMEMMEVALPGLPQLHSRHPVSTAILRLSRKLSQLT